MKPYHSQQHGWDWRSFMLNEIRQTQKDKYHDLLMWSLKKINKNDDLIEVKSIMVITRD